MEPTTLLLIIVVSVLPVAAFIITYLITRGDGKRKK